MYKRKKYAFIQLCIVLHTDLCLSLCIHTGQKIWGQAEKVGAVQLGEEKTAWRPRSNPPISEVGLQGSQRQILYQEMKVSYMEEILYCDGAEALE